MNTAYRALVDAGLAENFSVTPAGFEALSPYKVDNAIIMAAGLSSRFAPLSYEKPKGVLTVRGEVTSSGRSASFRRRASPTSPSSWGI